MISILKERLTKLTSLPKSKDTYGLTHTDFHQSNFYLHNGDIYLFDFDDCGYTYFVNDIANGWFNATEGISGNMGNSIFTPYGRY
ncbi:phosphotransferase [Paenibacillus sp. HGF5]|uniref:phosphotransferase n=1 Tax=Paenibacillus sp. HGF5 TaxID=908341 RepID=UPI00020724D0|nr:hypothetical protein HMPREF9412_4343 [Paenibacillus sp. HGF5]